MNNELSDSRWKFIEKATKDIDSWTDSEKAEMYPQRAFNSTQENGMQSEQQAREAAVTAFEQAVQNGILDFDPLVACYYGFKSGYYSRDAEVEALREALRGWQSWFLGPASQGIDYIKPPLERTKAALSSGTQETK